MASSSSSATTFVTGTTTSSSNGLTKTPLITHFRASKSVPSSLNLKIEDKQNVGFSICAASMNMEVKSRFGSLRNGGGAVLDRPSFDQSQFDPFTQVEEGGDIGRLKDKKSTGSGDSYRVLLLDDVRHTEKLVLKVLPQAVPSVSPDDARRIFSESRQNGLAVVIVTVKEHAEFYSQMMIRGGLRSSIEPESNTV